MLAQKREAAEAARCVELAETEKVSLASALLLPLLETLSCADLSSSPNPGH